MSDYISRQAALNIRFNDAINEAGVLYVPLRDFTSGLKTLPTADVVEAVRCKDCKHRIYDKSRDLYYCEMYYGMGDVSDENFCSFGERADT